MKGRRYSMIKICVLIFLVSISLAEEEKESNSIKKVNKVNSWVDRANTVSDMMFNAKESYNSWAELFSSEQSSSDAAEEYYRKIQITVVLNYEDDPEFTHEEAEIIVSDLYFYQLCITTIAPGGHNTKCSNQWQVVFPTDESDFYRIVVTIHDVVVHKKILYTNAYFALYDQKVDLKKTILQLRKEKKEGKKDFGKGIEKDRLAAWESGEIKLKSRNSISMKGKQRTYNDYDELWENKFNYGSVVYRDQEKSQKKRCFEDIEDFDYTQRLIAATSMGRKCLAKYLFWYTKAITNGYSLVFKLNGQIKFRNYQFGRLHLLENISNFSPVAPHINGWDRRLVGKYNTCVS